MKTRNLISILGVICALQAQAAGAQEWGPEPRDARDRFAIVELYMADFRPARATLEVEGEEPRTGGGIGKFVVMRSTVHGFTDAVLINSMQPGNTIYGMCMEPGQPASVGNTYTFIVQDMSTGPMFQRRSMGYSGMSRMEQFLGAEMFAPYGDLAAAYETAPDHKLVAMQAVLYDIAHEDNLNNPLDFEGGKARVTAVGDTDLAAYQALALRSTPTGRHKFYVLGHEKAQDFMFYTVDGWNSNAPAINLARVPEPSQFLLLAVGLLALIVGSRSRV